MKRPQEIHIFDSEITEINVTKLNWSFIASLVLYLRISHFMYLYDPFPSQIKTIFFFPFFVLEIFKYNFNFGSLVQSDT